MTRTSKNNRPGRGLARLRRALSVLLCLCMALSLLPAAALAEEETQESTTRTLMENGLKNADDWTWTLAVNAAANAPDPVFDGEGKVTIVGSGANNMLAYKGTVDANDFDISFGLTPHMDPSACANDVKIRFKVGDNSYLQVRFKFGEGWIYAETTDGGRDLGSYDKFTWQTGVELKVKISLNDNILTVTVDGRDVITTTAEQSADIAKAGTAWGSFAIVSQYANQNYSVSNLYITTTEPEGTTKPDPEPEPDPDPDPAAPIHYDFGEDYDRILLPESALDSAADWDIKTSNASTITIADGAASIVGSGPINRMGYNVGRINANNFLIQLDLTLNAGNGNSNVKIAFKCTDQYEDDRLQVVLNTVQGGVYIERAYNNSVAAWGKTWSKGTADYTWKNDGTTYGVDILVSGDTITVYVNGEEITSYTHEDIASMGRGYFAIAGVFPAQNFTVSNLKITTNEAQTGEEYTVTTKVATNGDENDPSGGTLTAIPDRGYSGDVIELTAIPAHGYVFEKYLSYKADGSSTDGLMPINNNKFTLDNKFGSVTVVAHFVTRTPGKFELYYDDFGADELDEAWVTVRAPELLTQNGELTIQAETSNYALLDQGIFDRLLDGEGYRISVDASGSGGTMQIMFKGSDQDINGRYVLVLNGSAALFRYIDPSSDTNVELAKTVFSFSTTPVTLTLEVMGDTVTLFADGREILSYTTDDSWKGAANAVGLINMTGGAVFKFDNLLVERIPEELPVNVTTMLGDAVDADYISGAAAADARTAIAGDTITLTSVAKAGYALKEYTVTSNGMVIEVNSDGTFTVPDGASGAIEVTAVFAPVSLREARSFYIDSEGGDDSGDGTIARPWKTLGKLTAYTANDPLVPGDTVYLKRGSVFTAQVLTFSGMGSADAPVTITAYGDGSDLPLLAGNGAVENVVSLYNQEYITISDLQITNTSAKYNSDFNLNSSNNISLTLRAINVSAKDFGTVNGITIQNCYIHDINGNINLKWNGGIFFDVQASVAEMVLFGVPTKYDGILIEGCTFINVDRSGIKLVSSAWCNQWLKNDPSKPVNWYPSTNAVIRNNYMEKIGGDGITTRDTDGTLIEYNLMKDCRYQNSAYNVAIWPFQAANTVIQYNEAYNTHSVQDGQGLDCDHASSYTVMQYNYSHNNEGGFMLIMGGYPHTAATVRYNLSVNDCDKTFEFAQGIPMGTMIYNNTLYSDKVLKNGILYLSNTSVGVGVNDVYLFNNLFCYPEGQPLYCSNGFETAMANAAKLYNNAYTGGMAVPAADANAIAADSGAVFVSAGSMPEGETTPITGSSEELAGYQLAEGSPLIDKGVTLAEAIEYFGGDIVTLADYRSDSPNTLFYRYYNVSGARSIDYVMGSHFPDVAGVNYDLDFFGIRNLEGAAPDIGAAEYLQHTHSGGSATCSSKAVCEICGEEYGEFDPNNHTGNTVVLGAVEATDTQAGYTGDTYCADCGVQLAAGHVIPATGGTSLPVVPVIPSVPSVNPTTPAEPPALTEPDAPVSEMPFTDVAAGTYYYDAVLWAVENGITTGASASAFAPDKACTRAEIVTFLWRAVGSPEPAGSVNPFTDVAADAYYYKAVLWAVENGITTGTSASAFSPTDTCTRAQAVTFLCRAVGQAVSASNPFTDVAADAYYYSAVLWAVENSITTGTSASAFSPEKICTRAEIVTFLYRACAD